MSTKGFYPIGQDEVVLGKNSLGGFCTIIAVLLKECSVELVSDGKEWDERRRGVGMLIGDGRYALRSWE